MCGSLCVDCNTVSTAVGAMHFTLAMYIQNTHKYDTVQVTETRQPIKDNQSLLPLKKRESQTKKRQNLTYQTTVKVFVPGDVIDVFIIQTFEGGLGPTVHGECLQSREGGIKGRVDHSQPGSLVQCASARHGRRGQRLSHNTTLSSLSHKQGEPITSVFVLVILLPVHPLSSPQNHSQLAFSVGDPSPFLPLYFFLFWGHLVGRF